MHILGNLRQIVPEEAVRPSEHVSPIERVEVRYGVKVLLPVFSRAIHFTHLSQSKRKKFKCI